MPTKKRRTPPQRTVTSAPPISPKQYVLGFPSTPTDPLDYRTIFQSSMQRLRCLLSDRLLGISPPTLSEPDRKLLAGELELLVPPGCTIHLTAQPLVCFKPSHLVIDDEAADWYDVFDVKVGRNSQFISASRVPGSQFKATSSPQLSMDTAQITMNITVSLTNTSDQPRRYPRISMYGSYAE
jgi:hypothetical protein